MLQNKFCECGCGEIIFITSRHKYDGIPRFVNGHNSKGKNNPMYGKNHTEDSRKKMSEIKKKDGHLKGILKTENHKIKISESLKNKYVGEDSPAWKGGKQLTRRKKYAKRKQFGFIPLNNCEEKEWVGHHLDYAYVLYIPKELHISINHSVLNNINMDIINDRVYEWFIKQYQL